MEHSRAWLRSVPPVTGQAVLAVMVTLRVQTKRAEVGHTGYQPASQERRLGQRKGWYQVPSICLLHSVGIFIYFYTFKQYLCNKQLGYDRDLGNNWKVSSHCTFNSEPWKRDFCWACLNLVFWMTLPPDTPIYGHRWSCFLSVDLGISLLRVSQKDLPEFSLQGTGLPSRPREQLHCRLGALNAISERASCVTQPTGISQVPMLHKPFHGWVTLKDTSFEQKAWTS